MTTISVPISSQLEDQLKNLIKSGYYGSNKADVIRRAITRMAEEEAVQAVLRAQQEPSLSGDLKKLAKKFR